MSGELTEVRALLFQLKEAQGETRAELRNLRHDIEERSERIDRIDENLDEVKRQAAFTAGRNSIISLIVSALTSLGIGWGIRHL